MTQLGNENRRTRAVNPASCGSLVTRKIVQTSPHEFRTVANARQLAKHFSGEHHRNCYRKETVSIVLRQKPRILLSFLFLFCSNFWWNNDYVSRDIEISGTIIEEYSIFPCKFMEIWMFVGKIWIFMNRNLF